MKTDRELLELAGKAVGYLATATVQDGFGCIAMKVMDSDGDWLDGEWNPLTDDGTGAGMQLDWSGRNEEDYFPVGTQFYAAPPKRQPLTISEIDLLAGKNQNNDGTVNYLPFARAIEAKLKEKNV